MPEHVINDGHPGAGQATGFPGVLSRRPGQADLLDGPPAGPTSMIERRVVAARPVLPA
jgi:hypothetical protein